LRGAFNDTSRPQRSHKVGAAMVVVVTSVAGSDTSSSLPVCRCHVSLSSPLHAERASPVRIATGNTRATARDACVAEASGSRRCTRAGGLAAGVVVPLRLLIVVSLFAPLSTRQPFPLAFGCLKKLLFRALFFKSPFSKTCLRRAKNSAPLAQQTHQPNLRPQTSSCDSNKTSIT